MLSADPGQQENKIKELFQRQKRDDEGSAPPFASLWESARRRAVWRSQPGHVFQPALAAAIVLLAVVSVLVTLKVSDRSQKTDSAISDWRSPTQSLLTLSGQDIMKSVPQFGKPYLDYISQ
jgi:hypothetical protein